jgi:hypothetical protein
MPCCTFSTWGNFIPACCPSRTAVNANPCLSDCEVTGPCHRTLFAIYGLCARMRHCCTVSPYLLSLYWILVSFWVLKVQGKHGLNSMPCPFKPMLLSTASKSLNFHGSHPLPDSLEIQIHMCMCWLWSGRGNFFPSFLNWYVCTCCF